MKKLQPITKSIRAFIVLIITLLCSISNTTSQDRDYKKNSAYLSYGTTIFSDQISFSYERTVYTENKFRIKAKVNYGSYSDKTLDYDKGSKIYKKYYGISGVMVYSLFEFNLGVASADYTLASGDSPLPGVDYDRVRNGRVFQVSTGIRYEKNEYLLRAGFGNLELLYFGAGFNF